MLQELLSPLETLATLFDDNLGQVVHMYDVAGATVSTGDAGDAV